MKERKFETSPTAFQGCGCQAVASHPSTTLLEVAPKLHRMLAYPTLRGQGQCTPKSCLVGAARSMWLASAEMVAEPLFSMVPPWLEHTLCLGTCRQTPRLEICALRRQELEAGPGFETMAGALQVMIWQEGIWKNASPKLPPTTFQGFEWQVATSHHCKPLPAFVQSECSEANVRFDHPA